MQTCDFVMEGSPRRTLIYPLNYTPLGSFCSPNTKWWPPIKAKFDSIEKPFNSMSSSMGSWQRRKGPSTKFQIVVPINEHDE